MHITTKALVLRTTDYKESDKILTLFTQDQGKLTASARGCRKKGSAIAAGCQLLAWSEMVLYDYQGRWAVKEAAAERLFQGVRDDIGRLALGCYFAEVTELLAVEGEENPELLSLILNSLHVLDKLPDKPLPLVKAVFEWKAMALEGYEPLIGGGEVRGEGVSLPLSPPPWPPWTTSSTATPGGCFPSAWRGRTWSSWPILRRPTSAPSWSGGFLPWITTRACRWSRSCLDAELCGNKAPKIAFSVLCMIISG